MTTSVLGPGETVADGIVPLFMSGDLLELGEMFLVGAVLCALVALIKAVFGRVPLVEKLADKKKISEVGVEEWLEAGVVAVAVGWLLVVCF